jgi:hypothetical protein
MSKTQISREKLHAKALSALRCEPGCNGVESVNLTTVTIVNDGSIEWHLEVTDPGDTDPRLTYRAADRVKEALATRYILADP